MRILAENIINYTSQTLKCQGFRGFAQNKKQHVDHAVFLQSKNYFYYSYTVMQIGN